MNISLGPKGKSSTESLSGQAQNEAQPRKQAGILTILLAAATFLYPAIIMNVLVAYQHKTGIYYNVDGMILSRTGSMVEGFLYGTLLLVPLYIIFFFIFHLFDRSQFARIILFIIILCAGILSGILYGNHVAG